MGDLLLNWLNDQVQLSKRVTNFEEDFHNGFLFGELLAKHSQQLNFHEFIDKDDKASRINNYSHLLETFTALRVTYDSNVVMKMINKQLGVAKKLLYELKTQLEKTNDNAFTKTNKLTKTLTPLKKIQISKDKFDQVQKEHFVKQLNQLHPAQKQIIQQNLLKKFSDFQHKSTVKASLQEEKDNQARFFLRSKFYEQQRDNLKKSQEFRKQWQADNMQKWANNMTIRQTQIVKDEQYKSKIQETKSMNKTFAQVNALKALQNDIADFERRNLKSRKGAIKQIDSDDQNPPLKQLKISKGISISEKEKASPEPRQQRRLPAGQNERKKHQREKRRRKMIVEQLKRYQLVEIARRQRCIIATIEQTSKQEKEIQYQIWRAWQNKNIITENRALQTEKIREKEEIREINAKFKRDQLLKTYRQEHKAEVQAQLKTNTVLQRSHQVTLRKSVYSQCQKMVLQLLEITQKMYTTCQERNDSLIDQELLHSQFVKFIENTSPSNQGLLKLKHYIEGSHEWSFPIVRPEEQVSLDPKEDFSLPNQYVNNYYLGNILKNIFQRQLGNVSQIQQSHNNRLVVALVGLDFSRKHFIAEKMKQIYKFQVVSVDKLIQSKLKDWMDFKDKNLQISTETQDLASQCFSGKPLNQSLINKLIKQSIETSKENIVILDYPNTYDQAIELCKLIANVQPHDLLSSNRLSKKIQEFSRIVKPTEAKIRERQIKMCGIDFVWWIDTNAENSLDRMLGRRWIGQKQVHIYDDIDPDQLKEGDKAASLTSRNNFKLKHKQNIKEWFSLFGFQIEQQGLTRLCWQQIEGNVQQTTLQKDLISRVADIIKIKEKHNQYLVKKKEQQTEFKNKKQLQDKEKQEIKQKCIKANPQDIKSQLSVALNKVDLDSEFISKTAQIWNKVEQATINSLTRTFQSLEQQQYSKHSYLAHLKRNFIALLTREDHKFHLIKDFQTRYNNFIKENEDMLAYDYSKEQLHQRVEDLENDLLNVVEEKKEDAISERSAIMSSGWLEAQLDFIYQSLYVLVQAQLNRFAACQKIIIDYYSKKFMCGTKGFEPLVPGLNGETFATLEAYKGGVCPKLDKIISEALRLLNREQEAIDDKNKKGGKGAPPKKDEKKNTKKGKDEVEEIKEATTEEIEMKKAVNTQKAILRQRLNKIKTLGTEKIKNTHDNANKLYSQLEDLYLYTYKVEQKAVLGLAKIFRKAIQRQEKIESQVQIKHVEVTQTEHIRNFEKPKPVIQPAQQKATQTNFTLSNLQEVFKLIREQAEGAKISTKRLSILLKRLISNPQLRKLLPQTWKSIKPNQIQSFVKLLDRSNLAYVDLINLFIFIVMSGYTLPSKEQLTQYNLELTNFSALKELTLECFVQKPSWFDEQIVQKQNVRPFDRNRYIKAILFEIFKHEDSIDIASYLQTLSLVEVAEFRELKSGQTYFDVAFS